MVKLKFGSKMGGGYVEMFLLASAIGIASGTFMGIRAARQMPITAECYAIQRYGDHVAPLTSSERDEWYKDMGGVEKGQRPNYNQLEHFIKNCKNNVFF